MLLSCSDCKAFRNEAQTNQSLKTKMSSMKTLSCIWGPEMLFIWRDEVMILKETTVTTSHISTYQMIVILIILYSWITMLTRTKRKRVQILAEVISPRPKKTILTATSFFYLNHKAHPPHPPPIKDISSLTHFLLLLS